MISDMKAKQSTAASVDDQPAAQVASEEQEQALRAAQFKLSFIDRNGKKLVRH